MVHVQWVWRSNIAGRWEDNRETLLIILSLSRASDTKILHSRSVDGARNVFTSGMLYSVVSSPLQDSQNTVALWCKNTAGQSVGEAMQGAVSLLYSDTEYISDSSMRSTWAAVRQSIRALGFLTFRICHHALWSRGIENEYCSLSGFRGSTVQLS